MPAETHSHRAPLDRETVALIVREGIGPVHDVVTALPDFPDEQKRVIAASVAGDVITLDPGGAALHPASGPRRHPRR